MARSLSAAEDMETTRSSCGRRRPENASTPWKATGTFVGLCYCVGKTVKVTVLPTPTPRSAGERRRRPLYMCSLTFQKNGSGQVIACDFAPDGKTVVSASQDDKTVRIWDVESGKCLTTLEGHRYLCHCGRQIVGKTVNVTVLPTPTPRSAGERRRVVPVKLTFEKMAAVK